MEKFPFQTAYEMEVKSTRSDKLYNVLATIAAIVSALLIAICYLICFINQKVGMDAFTVLFYPALSALISSLYLTVSQICRNRYLSVIIALILNALTFVGMVLSIILQIIYLDTVLIFPFNLI